jgi:hypothetical protein
VASCHVRIPGATRHCNMRPTALCSIEQKGYDALENVREGGCACGQSRYRLTSPPLFVHCCHCKDCQRQTGSAFVLNALIETDRVEIRSGTTDLHPMPTDSGKPHEVARCPSCGSARSTIPPPCRRTSTSTHARNFPGSRCPRTCRRSRRITPRARCGRPKASPAAVPCSADPLAPRRLLL